MHARTAARTSPPGSQAAWCECQLAGTDARSCAALRPWWANDHTGRRGELFIRLQDGGFGNVMHHLWESLFVAVLLDRRPVLIRNGPFGANFTDFFDLVGGMRITSYDPVGRVEHVNSVRDAARVLAAPPPPRVPVFMHLFWGFYSSTHTKFMRIHKDLRRTKGTAASRVAARFTHLFHHSEPQCWSALFLRPSSLVREAVVPRVRSICAAVHVRACASLEWKDGCPAHRQVAQPEVTAVSIAACTGCQSHERVHVASDSQALMRSLAASPRFSSFATLGRPLHIGKVPRTEWRFTELARIVYDWASFAYSTRAASLPSSFPATAICMLAPHRNYTVFRPPRAPARLVECGAPLASTHTAFTQSRTARSVHVCALPMEIVSGVQL